MESILEFSYNGIKYIYRDDRLFINNIVYYSCFPGLSYEKFIYKKYLLLKYEKYVGYFTFSNFEDLEWSNWESILLDDIIELRSIRDIYNILEG